MKIYYRHINNGEMDDEDSVQEAANVPEFLAFMRMWKHNVKITQTEGTPSAGSAEAFRKNTTVASLPADFKINNPNLSGPTAPPMPEDSPGKIVGQVQPAIVQQTIGQVPIQQAPPAVIVPPIEFENGGVKFKIVDGIVYKKDWINVDMNEYRITHDSKAALDLIDKAVFENLKIQKLDWIKIENSPTN